MNLLTICDTCETEKGAQPIAGFDDEIRSALEAAGLGGQLDVRRFGCLGVCSEPFTISLQGDGRATYVFSGISRETDMADIVATCRAFIESRNGWIEDARPCGRLRHCLKSRVPAMSGK